MPRKKPFSSKQKKKQLQDKRRRKQDTDFSHGGDSLVDSDDDDKDSGPESEQGTSKHVNKINQQPGNQLLPGKYDPNRYRLHFFKESAEDLAKRKKFARIPYMSLPEESLELPIDTSVDGLIDIPVRPSWDYSLSKHKLESNEERYFKGYIDRLFSQHNAEELSYFELNLETWRQLWRVLEMSDVFLLITDIRHPVLHFSPALYKHISEDLKKPVILVLNKVDLAPPPLVVAWQHFFKTKFPLINVVCFTSFPKTKEELEKLSGSLGKVVFKKRRPGTYRALGPQELYKICASIVNKDVDLTSWQSKIESDQGLGYHGDSEEEDGEEEENLKMEKPDCSFQKHERYKDGVLTIGCIGYPNVGKSSVLNGLMGKKVVSVSKTPGHTKHFQTIYLTPTVRLCDSPGLVFPSKVDKHLQIIGGIFPISQVREPYTTVGYLAQRLDLPRLLRLKPVDEDVKEEDVKWTGMDVCDAWADKKGFITARASRPDTYRAANSLLRLAVDGRLCLCLRPMHYTEDKELWKNHSDTKDFIELQHSYRQSVQASVDSDSENADSSCDEEGQEGKEELSEEENQGRQSETFVSSNLFDMLTEED